MPTVTENDLFRVVRSFVLSLIECEVIRGLDNGVPMPEGGFIALSPLFADRLATNEHSYTATTQTTSASTRYAMQIDCYGPSSCDWAATLAMMFRDEYACTQFGQDIQPLHADDPKMLPLVNGEQQYEQRWAITAYMQYRPSVTTAIESANMLGSVTTYPVA
jgi:hypothetical protein